MSAPVCPYCGGASRHLANSARLYGTDRGPVYLCAPCPEAAGGKAWVGIDRNGAARGRLADARLRRWKQRLRRALAPLVTRAAKREGWTPSRARREAQAWLSREAGVGTNVHLFDVAECERAVVACEAAQARAGLAPAPTLGL